MYRIYRNLHRGDWTIQHHVKGKGWRKLRSQEIVTAPSVEFIIYTAGRNRARHEGKKNVHAFAVVPYLLMNNVVHPCDGDYAISYTPFDELGFRTHTERRHLRWYHSWRCPDLPSRWADLLPHGEPWLTP